MTVSFDRILDFDPPLNPALPPSQVPWDDLRYIFGEIMYGGHIVEDWDRRLANR